MKLIKVLFIAIFLTGCTTIGYPADKKPAVDPRKVELTEQLEQLNGTIFYINDRMELIKQQYEKFVTVKQQAERDRAIIQQQLKAMEPKKK